MKLPLLVFGSVVLALAVVDAQAASESRMESQFGGHSTASRFHLITMKCQGEDAAGPESTPQSPPLNVDDPATPGCNRWEINVVADGDLSRDERTYELPLLDINYGIGDNLQLKYERPYSSTQTSEGARSAAVGDSKIGVKYNFFNDEAREIEVAIYPQVTLVNPPADANGSRKMQTLTTLPLLLTKTLGKVTQGDVNLTTNFAYTLSKKPDTKDYLSVSVGIGMPITPRLSGMGEVVTDQAFASDADGRRAALVKANLGVVTTISKHFLLFGSVGHSLASADHLDHEYALIGFRVVAGGGVPNDPVLASARP